MRRAPASLEGQGDQEGPSALETRRDPDLPSVPGVPPFPALPLIPARPWGPRLRSDPEAQVLHESQFSPEDRSRRHCLLALGMDF